MKMLTGTVSGTLTITKELGVQSIHLKVTGNGATIAGDYTKPAAMTGLTDGPIGLADGDSQFINAGPGSYIDGVTINQGGAVVEVEIFFQ